ncbi:MULTISPECIES: hypothetical protein, partial [unclassified Microcoleus]|uniref:hypothetical protein n=1 Tax=unclassified Microcoleus TaxID=2642155 RepID=UPI002FCFDD47
MEGLKYGLSATWAFNNRVQDGSGLVQLRLSRDKKKIREKNAEDCRELSHHPYHVEREVKPSVY